MLDPQSLAVVMRDVDTVYYLIHSLGSGSDFTERDTTAAGNCAAAARHAGVKRIIYLGGLGDPRADLSQHLRSRQETGLALREAGVPVTESRAAVIARSGSLSFEMIRYLTERLPVMICPRWVFTRVQPIAIQNVLDYLIAALESPETAGRILEIGGFCSHLRRDDDWLRTGQRIKALVDRGASVNAEIVVLLGASDHADSGPHSATANQRFGQRGDCARRNGPPTFSLNCIARLRNCRSPGFKADGDAWRGNGMGAMR